MRREFLTGSGDWGYDAYFQAVTEGMLDPKEMDFELFSLKSNHERISLSDETDEYFKEVFRSFKNVGKFFRSESERQEVVKEWFGEDYLLNNQ